MAIKQARSWVLGLGALSAAACMAGAHAQQNPAVPSMAAEAGNFSLPEPGIRLISQTQYVNTIKQIFGEDISLTVRFAPVKRIEGLLALGARSAVMTSGAFDPLDTTARSIAAQVVDTNHRAFLIPCRPARPGQADSPCTRQFITETGRMLFRRPLTEQEVQNYVATADHAAASANDPYAGLATALSGMLVSPQFLYIRETSEPDPASRNAWRLDGYSKASRLSFLLWDSTPDAQLLTAAARGDLHRPEGLRRELDRMIASPRYKTGVEEFFSDFLALEAFDTLAKDPTIYPAFSFKAVAEAREQILRTVVEHLVKDGGDYRDLFTTRKIQMSSELGVIYRIPVNAGARGWVLHEFPANDPRAGLLAQVGFLAQYAHAGRSSPTRRGRGVREVLLCQHVPDPPPNVDFSSFEGPKAGVRTARDRIALHNENPVCAGCHKLTDPIGLALENFDGAGQFREREVGLPIDPRGELDGVKFSDPAGLGRALRDSPALKSCIVNRLYSYSLGRAVLSGEEARLARYEAAFDKRGYHFEDMLRTIVLDDSFFAVKPQVVSTALSIGGRNAY